MPDRLCQRHPIPHMVPTQMNSELTRPPPLIVLEWAAPHHILDREPITFLLLSQFQNCAVQQEHNGNAQWLAMDIKKPCDISATGCVYWETVYAARLAVITSSLVWTAGIFRTPEQNRLIADRLSIKSSLPALAT